MELVSLSRKAQYLHDPATGRNVGLVTTRDELVLIDAGDSATDVRRVLQRVSEISSLPIAYCILTHWAGNDVVSALADVSIIVHKAATTFPGACPDTAASDAVRLFFGDRVYLSVGGTIIEVAHTPGSSPGSCVVTVPSDGVLFGGDTVRVFESDTVRVDESDTVRVDESDTVRVDEFPPVTPEAAREWATSVAALLSLNARHVVPARGRLGSPADLTTLAAALRDRSGLPQRVEPLAPRRAARESRYLQMAASDLEGPGLAVVGMSAKGATGR